VRVVQAHQPHREHGDMGTGGAAPGSRVEGVGVSCPGKRASFSTVLPTASQIGIVVIFYKKMSLQEARGTGRHRAFGGMPPRRWSF
jgi:hypothetical protein